MLIQAFVAEFAIEALNVAILHRPARFNQNVADTMTLCPAMKALLVNSWPLSVRTALGYPRNAAA